MPPSRHTAALFLSDPISRAPARPHVQSLGAKKKAEKTLKIEIDEEAFARINGHESHPFPVQPGQAIAFRVISQFGEETTKVLTA